MTALSAGAPTARQFTIGGVLAAVSYYYLRAEKEGVAVDELARVFD